MEQSEQKKQNIEDIPNVFHFICGGKEFMVAKTTLAQYPNCLINKILMHCIDMKPGNLIRAKNGTMVPYIEGNPKIMRSILDGCVIGIFEKPNDLSDIMWEKSLEYFGFHNLDDAEVEHPIDDKEVAHETMAFINVINKIRPSWYKKIEKIYLFYNQIFYNDIDNFIKIFNSISESFKMSTDYIKIKKPLYFKKMGKYFMKFGYEYERKGLDKIMILRIVHEKSILQEIKVDEMEKLIMEQQVEPRFIQHKHILVNSNCLTIQIN